MRRLLGSCLAVALLLAEHTAFAAPAGQVLAASGQAFIETGGQRNPAKPGDPVSVGDTLDVPQGAKVKLRMNDGSVIAAAAGSRLTIEAYESDGSGRNAQLNLASGLLRAVVTQVNQPSRFEVSTATGVAAVRSTDWFVAANPGSTQVGVLEGAVNLTSAATKRAVRIPARWGARVETGKDPVSPRVWEQREFDDVIARTDLN